MYDGDGKKLVRVSSLPMLVWNQGQAHALQVSAKNLSASFSFLGAWAIISGAGRRIGGVQYAGWELYRSFANELFVDEGHRYFHGVVCSLLSAYGEGRVANELSFHSISKDGAPSVEQLIYKTGLWGVQKDFWTREHGRNAEAVRRIFAERGELRNAEAVRRIFAERGELCCRKASPSLQVFLLFLLLHAEADRDILAEDSLDTARWNGWGSGLERLRGKTSLELLYELMDEAERRRASSEAETSRCVQLPVAGGELKLPLYLGREDEDFEDEIEIVRLDKPEGEGGGATRLTLGPLARELRSGETLFALRKRGKFIRFLPAESYEGGYRYARATGKENALLKIDTATGASEKTRIPGVQIPACWGVSPRNSMQRRDERLAVVLESGDTLVKGFALPGKERNALVSLAGDTICALRLNGEVWCNLAGAQELLKCVDAAADLDAAYLLDTQRRLWRLSSGELRPLPLRPVAGQDAQEVLEFVCSRGRLLALFADGCVAEYERNSWRSLARSASGLRMGAKGAEALLENANGAAYWKVLGS